MWAAYFLFDLCFVLAISIAFTVTITIQFKYWEGAEYMFPICLLHGICCIFVCYLTSLRATSQLSAFLWALVFMIIPYFCLGLTYTVSLSAYISSRGVA